MIKEIYIRDENDPFYDSTMIDYQNEVESVISQIKVILGTRNGDVLGAYDLGVDLDYMVFNTRKSAQEISDKIAEQINKYVYHNSQMTITCETEFGDSGKGYDYAVINIYINGVKAIGFLLDKD